MSGFLEARAGKGHRPVGLLELFFDGRQPIYDGFPFDALGLFRRKSRIAWGGSRCRSKFGCSDLRLECLNFCTRSDDARLDFRIVSQRLGLFEFLCGFVQQSGFLSDRLMGCRSLIEGSGCIDELFVRIVKTCLRRVEFCADADACLLNFSPSIRGGVKGSLLFLPSVFRCWDRRLGDCERLAQLGSPSDRLRALNL